MRSLIYVPILHADAELGSVASEVRRQFESAFGQEQWARRGASIEAMWEGIRTKLLALPLAWSTVRLYQDGLPWCGREDDIVRELAMQGSPNHRLLLEFMDRGAMLMGTEDPDCLVAEYRRIQRLVQVAHAGAQPAELAALKQEGEAILAKRDQFMAARIAASLGEAETGLFFVGLTHRVDQLLDSAFAVRHVIHSLP